MIPDNIHVAIKSYKRAGKVVTADVVPFASIWVPESQGEEYRAFYGDRVITIPDTEDGNLCRKSNAILNRSPAPWTLILDDDISKIGMFEDGKKFTLDVEQVENLIITGFDLAHQMGVELWGIGQNSDELIHYTYRPFSLLSPILGPFNGHLSPTIRYDEAMKGKDDYDFWLQTIQAHRFTLRINKYHYHHDHGKAPGGWVSQRTMASEQQGIEALVKKWGSKIVKPGGSAGGKSATGKNILNTLVKIPIPGC